MVERARSGVVKDIKEAAGLAVVDVMYDDALGHIVDVRVPEDRIPYELELEERVSVILDEDDAKHVSKCVRIERLEEA